MFRIGGIVPPEGDLVAGMFQNDALVVVIGPVAAVQAILHGDTQVIRFLESHTGPVRPGLEGKGHAAACYIRTH